MQRLSVMEPDKFYFFSGAYSLIKARAFCCIVLKML